MGIEWAIRLDLAGVGLDALGVIAALLEHEPSSTARGWRLAALIGALPFALQTAVLDALVWPAFFSR